MSEDVNVSGENLEAAAPEEVSQSENQPDAAVKEDSEQNQNVPLTALQSERSRRQQLEDELKMMKDHVALLSSQSNQQSNNQKQKKDVLDELDDSDLLTVGDFKKKLEPLVNQYKLSMEEIKVMQKYPDYQDVVTNYLPELLKQNPRLQRTLYETQDYELAYYLAKHSDAYKEKTTKSKKFNNAQRAIENSQKAGSLSSMGSTSPISEAKRYKDMSDSEFMEFANRNLG